MSLNCLLLTRDATLLEVFRIAFSAVSVELEMRSDAASAIELSTRRHLDGFVIDCDDVSGGAAMCSPRYAAVALTRRRSSLPSLTVEPA